MQFVGTHQVLGYLGDVAVFVRGQEFRADRCVENAYQHLPEFRVVNGARVVFYDVAHQGLGHGSVHAVHRDVVAVVGSPAQREFRKVAGAHHHAVFSVREVHEYLGALACLAVFVYNVVDALVVPYIGEMLPYRSRDVDDPQLRAQEFAQAFRVAAGALCRAETRHSHREYIGSRTSQQLHCFHADQQRQGAVKPTGNAYHQGFRVGVAYAFFKPVRLHGEDILAALVLFRGSLRHERRAHDGAGERCF